MILQRAISYKRSIQEKRFRTIFLVLMCVICFFQLFYSSIALTVQTAGEYEVKAAFLYNFAKFIEWPKEALNENDSFIIIGILGDDPFGNILDNTVSGKTVNNKKFVIKRYKTSEDIETCHILFISSTDEKQAGKILQKLNRSGMLTVSDNKSFINEGGMVNFVIESNKVKFEINLDATQKAGLKISSKLLTLAASVKGKSQPKGNE